MLANQTFPLLNQAIKTTSVNSPTDTPQDSYIRFLRTHGYDPAVTVPSFGASVLCKYVALNRTPVQAHTSFALLIFF